MDYELLETQFDTAPASYAAVLTHAYSESALKLSQELPFQVSVWQRTSGTLKCKVDLAEKPLYFGIAGGYLLIVEPTRLRFFGHINRANDIEIEWDLDPEEEGGITYFTYNRGLCALGNSKALYIISTSDPSKKLSGSL